MAVLIKGKFAFPGKGQILGCTLQDAMYNLVEFRTRPRAFTPVQVLASLIKFQ